MLEAPITGAAAPITPEVAPTPVVEEVKPKPEGDGELARKFAALSRKERDIMLREKALKDKEPKYQQWEKADADPLAYLEAKGLTVEEIIQRALKKGEPVTMEDEVKILKEQLAEEKKQREQYLTKLEVEKQNQAIANFKKGIDDHIKSDPDKYETIITEGAEDEVFNLIEEHYKRNQADIDSGEMKMLSQQQAAERVEEHLFARAEKLSKLKKLQPKTDPEPAPDAPATTTLTNKIAPALQPAKTRLLSTEESLKQSASMIRWTK